MHPTPPQPSPLQHQLLVSAAKNDTAAFTELLASSAEAKTLVHEPIPGIGATLLHVAASKGHAELVDVLLQEACDLEAVDPSGGTVLFSAVGGSGPLSERHHKVIAKLVEVGANVAATDTEGLTMLHEACNNGDEFTVKLLLNQDGVDANALAKSGVSPLHVVATGALHKPNVYDIMQLPVDASPEAIKKQYHALALKFHPDKQPAGENSKQPLAEVQRQFQLINMANSILSDPVSRDVYDNTYVRCANLLLANGADPSVKVENLTKVGTKVVHTALDLALQFKQWNVAIALSQHAKATELGVVGCQRNRTVLHHLVVTGKPSDGYWITKVLSSEQGVGMIARGDDFGKTPFHLACGVGQLGVVREMCEALGTAPQESPAGADKLGMVLNQADEEDETPLICAVKGSGSVDVVSYLLSFQQLDASKKDKGEYSALDYAEMYGEEKLIAVLKEKAK